MSAGVVIAGIGETEQGNLPHRSLLDLHADASRQAIADAGLAKRDIGAIFTAFNTGIPAMSSIQVAEYLGIAPVYSDSTDIGGASFVAHIEHAMAGMAAGLFDTALITYASNQRSLRSRSLSGSADPRLPASQFEVPYGPLLPISAYALVAQRHMALYGTTSEQLAEIAVATRKWARLNPAATQRGELGIDDVLASPLLSTPLHVLDCCLVTDGGAAVVLVRGDRVADLPKTPVRVLGTAETHTHDGISQMPDLMRSGAALTGATAFARAGLRPSDVDVAEIYDSFTITVLMALEDLGFCDKGEGGAFVAGQRTAPGGDFPLNTNGGGLSFSHPGMYGLFTVVEAVRQLRHECGERQVVDAEVALAHGIGGVLSSHGTALLGRG